MNGTHTLETPAKPVAGWRRTTEGLSLPEVNRSIAVPAHASFWRKLLAFAGPGFLVAVGYMDPGNWATDLAGGAKFGYTLLSVIMISNLMAILLQHLCIKLCSRAKYPSSSSSIFRHSCSLSSVCRYSTA